MKHRHLETTPETSKRMKSMSHKKSKVESMLAKALWHKGYRYRLNYKKLPGTPDIVLTKYKIVIFVDGEFWHGKDFDKNKSRLHQNKDYWIEKIEENIRRDEAIDKLLRQDGWVVLHYWSNDLKKELDACVEEIESFVELQKEGMKDS